jgi:predicted ATPase/DNA-binding XRE family transcriptional regulator
MFGEVVRDHRRRLHLTQEALAAKSGLGVRSIREIERGRGARPQARTVELLADAFDLVGEPRAAFRCAATGLTTGNLPAETTSLVGRDELVAGTVAALADSRLVTLVGVAGVGKSRLARRVAADLAAAHPGGAWLVDAGAERDEAGLARAVAEAVGVVDLGTPDPLTGVTAHLGAGRSLLVLDDCEHLVGACAAVVGRLLAGAPQLRVVVTSRQALGVTGEHVVRVPPLPADGDDAPALALFAERAATAAGFALTPATRPAAAELCRRLDGLPLALELAAVRLRALSLDDVLAGTAAVLEAGDSGDGRHRSLAAAIGGSWDLCSPAERRLWSRLSVFAGDVDLDAAQAVAGDGEPVLPAVVGLVEKSVLLPVRPAGADDTAAGGIRYRLLESLRRFGIERLRAAGEVAEARQRHLRWYAALAARAQADSCTPRQVTWQRRLAAERADLRAALDHALTEPGLRSEGLLLVADLRDHWITGSRLGEARAWLDRALAAPDPAAPVTVLWLGAAVALLQGDGVTARARLAAGTAAAKARGDAEGAAYLAFVSAAATLAAGDVPASVPELRQARSALAGAARPDAVALAAPFLVALVELAGGDAAAALAESDRGRRVCEALGESWARSWCLWVAALAHRDRGETAAAATAARESLRLKRSLDDGLGLAATVDLLGRLAADAGEAERAAVLRGAAGRLWSAVGPAGAGLPRLPGLWRADDDAPPGTGDAASAASAAYGAAAGRGAALDRDAALDLALGDAPLAADTAR